MSALSGPHYVEVEDRHRDAEIKREDHWYIENVRAGVTFYFKDCADAIKFMMRDRIGEYEA